MVRKMESQSEYVRIAYTFFCTFGTDLHAQSVLINNFFASELSRNALRVVSWACSAYAQHIYFFLDKNYA